VPNNLELPLTRNAEMMAPDRLHCGVANITQKKYPWRRYYSFPDMGTPPHSASDTQPDP